MTTYFDQKHSEIREARQEHGGEALARRLDEIDTSVCWDATICAEMPGFPADLREQIAKVILARSVACQPSNAPGIGIDSAEEHARTVHGLVGDLHSVFHEVVARRLDGFSDNPRAPLHGMYGRGQELRERLAAKANPFELWRHAGGLMLFRASSGHVPPLLGPGAERIASFPVVTLEDAVREKCKLLGLPTPEDIYAAADAEREIFGALFDAAAEQKDGKKEVTSDM